MRNSSRGDPGGKVYLRYLLRQTVNKISPDSDRWGKELCWGEIYMGVAKRFNSTHVPLAARNISFSIGY